MKLKPIYPNSIRNAFWYGVILGMPFWMGYAMLMAGLGYALETIGWADANSGNWRNTAFFMVSGLAFMAGGLALVSRVQWKLMKAEEPCHDDARGE